MADNCACSHDGRGSLVSECSEHQRIREEHAEMLALLRARMQPFCPVSVQDDIRALIKRIDEGGN